MIKPRKKHGQTLLEYTLLVVLVLGAFVATGQYLKRGLQGRWKSAVDDLGEQYDPTVMLTSINHTINGNSQTTITAVRGTFGGSSGIWTMRRDTSNMTEKKEGASTVGSY